MFGLLRAGDALHHWSMVASRVFCLFALCGLAGCRDYGPPRGTEGLENLQPVTGSVSFEGQPTPGAIVLFFPADDPQSAEYRVAGTVEEDGSFEMKTTVPEGTRPGVAPGDYLVTISWNKLVDPGDRDSDEGPDLLPAMYKDCKRSGLRVEVVEGTNELQPFELSP
jgi:hypothetical protein